MPPESTSPGFGEDQRIVGGGSGLDFDAVGGEAQRAAHRAVHLRHAAQAVGVLHARGSGAARGIDVAPLQQRAQAGGDRALSRMRPRRVYALVEGDGRAEQGFQRHRARDVGEAREPGGAPERERAHGGERLRSIEQREAFLRCQADGFDAGALQGGAARHALAAIDRFAFADDAERQVGERGQIAGSAHRALRRDHGMNAAIQHERQRLGDDGAHAAVAERQRVGAQGHDDARLGLGERRAQPAGVAAHQVELQAGEFVIGYAHFAELAEAGVDAVDGRVIFHRAAHHLARCLHLSRRRRGRSAPGRSRPRWRRFRAGKGAVR